MRWAKVVMIALGALIAFVVIESVFRLLQWAFIALIIGVIIAIAVKANQRYKLARERRAQVRQERSARDREVREEPSREITPARAAVPPATAARADVDAELARLKREMGA